jgi:hypothetical protein
MSARLAVVVLGGAAHAGDEIPEAARLSIYKDAVHRSGWAHLDGPSLTLGEPVKSGDTHLVDAEIRDLRVAKFPSVDDNRRDPPRDAKFRVNLSTGQVKRIGSWHIRR